METSTRRNGRSGDRKPTGSNKPDDSQAVPEPEAFFRREGRDEARAAFARDQAQRTAPPTLLARWARAVRLPTAALPLVTIAIAVTYLWAQNLRPVWGRPQLVAGVALAIAVVLAVFGINLIRSITLDYRHPAAVLRERAVQVGCALLGVATAIGFNLTRGGPQALVVLAFIGWLACVGYVLAPLAGRPLPGLELVPVIILGPILYFVTLETLQGKALIITNGTWLLAGALFCLMGLRFLAGALGGAQPSTLELALGARLGRALYILLLLGAYGLIVLAGTGRHTSHAALAVLLSLPVAVLPLSGMAYAKARSALRVVVTQTQRLVIVFGLWLTIGFLLGGIYLRVLATVHPLPGIK